MGKDPTAINVRHQNHRAIHHFGKAHIGNIVVTQVDFRRTACAFGDNHIITGRETLPGRQHCLTGGVLIGVIIQCLHVAQHLATEYHLGPHIGLRLEQHRIHVTVRFNPAGQGL